jgi:hypothetical protein
MAAHRYWRVYITEAVHATHLDIREIEMHTSLGGADVCTGGTAIYSAETGGFEASKSFDDNSGTTWYISQGSYPLPQWIGYDFGSGNDKDIVELSLTAWTYTEQWVSFRFQHSDDASSWTTLFTVENDEPQDTNTPRTYSANDTPTMNGADTFWRVRSTTVDGGAEFGVAEIQFRTTGGGADQATGGKAFANRSQDPGNFLPGYAFDDNAASRWASVSGGVAGWIGYRWASAKSIVEAAVTARNDGFHSQAPKDFVIEYWDGSAYQTAYTSSSETGWTSGETRVFTWGTGPSSARPVVFICT